jgi:transposase
VTAFGALDYGSGVVLSAMAATGDAAQFRAFLDQLAARWDDAHLVLVLDNASYHKTADLRAWFAKHAERISVLWLPTYSPQLNLIERVWRFVKGKLACHRCWDDLPTLTQAAQTLLDQTRARFAASTYPHLTLGQDFWESA